MNILHTGFYFVIGLYINRYVSAFLMYIKIVQTFFRRLMWMHVHILQIDMLQILAIQNYPHNKSLI